MIMSNKVLVTTLIVLLSVTASLLYLRPTTNSSSTSSSHSPTDSRSAPNDTRCTKNPDGKHSYQVSRWLAGTFCNACLYKPYAPETCPKIQDHTSSCYTCGYRDPVQMQKDQAEREAEQLATQRESSKWENLWGAPLLSTEDDSSRNLNPYQETNDFPDHSQTEYIAPANS